MSDQQPTPPAPEREGVVDPFLPRPEHVTFAVERTDDELVDALIRNTEIGSFGGQSPDANHERWLLARACRNDLIRRLAAPAPATGEVERITALAYDYGAARDDYEYRDGPMDVYDAAYAAFDDALATALAAPAALVVPADVGWANYLYGYEPDERWTVGLINEHPDDGVSREGDGATFAQAVASARVSRGGS